MSPVTSTVPPTSASNQQKEKKKKKKDPSKGRWVEGITSEGHHYYYDLITGGASFRHKDSRKWAELGCTAPLAIQGPRQLRGTFCGLCGCRSKRASDGTVLTFAGRGGRGWLRTRQVKKTEPADIRPAPTQALCTHDIAYFLISEWTRSLGFIEDLHSSRHPLKQRSPRGCGNLWGLLFRAAHFTPELA